MSYIGILDANKIVQTDMGGRVVATAVPSNSFDFSSNTLKIAVGSSGLEFLEASTRIGSYGTGIWNFGLTSTFIKEMQCSEPILANSPVSKTGDGSIVPADSDAINGQQVIGFASQAFVNVGDKGNIILIGPNIPALLTGKGYLSGQEIYVSETSGELTNNPGGLTDFNDSILLLGFADCAAGNASAIATDLILTMQIVLRP